MVRIRHQSHDCWNLSIILGVLIGSLLIIARFKMYINKNYKSRFIIIVLFLIIFLFLSFSVTK